MLVVFSPIFVGDTKIIYRYNFVAPLIPGFLRTVYGPPPLLLYISDLTDVISICKIAICVDRTLFQNGRVSNLW